MHSTAIFLGPSLDLKTASSLTDAEILGPVVKGDIYAQTSLGRRKILIIDGYFERATPVWHREILDAMDAGVEVVGAASMGALRAAELYQYGMRGIGQVFEWYRDSIIDGDDEVALLHGDEEVAFVPLSQPLVNIRYCLNLAVKDGYISFDSAKSVLNRARNTYFGERDLDYLTNHMDSLCRTRFLDYVKTIDFDIKRKDAVRAIESLAVDHARSDIRGNWFRPVKDRVDQYGVDRFSSSRFITADGLDLRGDYLISKVRESGHQFSRERLFESERFFLLKATQLLSLKVDFRWEEVEPRMKGDVPGGDTSPSISKIFQERFSQDSELRFFLGEVGKRLKLVKRKGKSAPTEQDSTCCDWTEILGGDSYFERRILMAYWVKHSFPSLLKGDLANEPPLSFAEQVPLLFEGEVASILSPELYSWIVGKGPGFFGYRFNGDIALLENLICCERLGEFS